MRVAGKARIIVISACLGLSLCLLVAVSLHLTADWLKESESADDLLTAARLEPDNAEIWRYLALLYYFPSTRQEVEKALSYYQKCVTLNPHSARYLSEMARLLELDGQIEPARDAWKRAEQSYPISAKVAWDYGNFLIRQGEFQPAAQRISRAVRTDPTLSHLAAMVLWNATQNADTIIEAVGTSNPEILFSLMNYLARQDELGPALQVWSNLQNLHEPIDLKRALPLLDQLIRAGRAEDARRVWQQALAAAHRSAEGPRGSLVWDGGFEEDFLRGGFGWRQADIPGASVSFDSSAPHSGSRALLLAFDGTANVDFGHVLQYVAVEPSTRYRVQAFFRLDDVSTDSGIRLRVFDLRNPQALDVSTPNLTGTLPWTQQELEFTTGPETRLLAIALRRTPSRKLDNKIRGSVWVDDVSLIAVGPRAPETKAAP